jgi:hypothetical protein
MALNYLGMLPGEKHFETFAIFSFFQYLSRYNVDTKSIFNWYNSLVCLIADKTILHRLYSANPILSPGIIYDGKSFSCLNFDFWHKNEIVIQTFMLWSWMHFMCASVGTHWANKLLASLSYFMNRITKIVKRLIP